MKDKLLKLEMMRGFAALYVMVGHISQHYSLGFGSRLDHLLFTPFRFGQEAVILFFLISGFVIFYSTEKKCPDFATYLSHRWRRIYPIFLLTLGLISFDLVVLQSKPFPWTEFFGNVFMLQDIEGKHPGAWFASFGGDQPLWSLAYEWWFYLLFYPIWRFVPAHRQRLTAAAVSFFGLLAYAFHPSQPYLYLTYFILWWTGAELARQYVATGEVSLAGQRPTLAVLAGFVGLTAGTLLLAHHWNHWTPVLWQPRQAYPFIEIRHFSTGLAMLVGALVWQRFQWRGFNACFGIFKYAAPISYGIYALHFHIAINSSFFPFLPADGAVKIIGVTAACVAAAWFAEGPFQKLVNRATRFLPNRTCGVAWKGGLNQPVNAPQNGR